jgi:hypothetical protein
LPRSAAPGPAENWTPICAAIHSFGNLSTVGDETRSAWSWTAVEFFFRDLGFSLFFNSAPARADRLH